jgi:hypothetical protein
MRLIQKEIEQIKRDTLTANRDFRSSPIPVRDYRELDVMIDVEALTGSATVQFFKQNPSNPNAWHPIGTTMTLSLGSNTVLFSGGFGANLSADFVVSGSVKLSMGLVGKQ